MRRRHVIGWALALAAAAASSASASTAGAAWVGRGNLVCPDGPGACSYRGASLACAAATDPDTPSGTCTASLRATLPGTPDPRCPGAGTLTFTGPDGVTVEVSVTVSHAMTYAGHGVAEGSAFSVAGTLLPFTGTLVRGVAIPDRPIGGPPFCLDPRDPTAPVAG